MHKLVEYVCDELEELERKADKGKLTMSDIQYADTLAHMKKNLLKADEMMDEEGYSSADGMMMGNRGRIYDGGRSYARGRGRNAKRDSMGRYSSNRGYSYEAEDMAEQLRDLMEDAPEQVKSDIKRLITKIENM